MYIDKSLAQKLMMQDEHDEGHEMLRFGMQKGFTKLHMNTEVKDSDPYGLGNGGRKDLLKEANEKWDFGMQATRQVKNRVVTPNPFYHHQKRKLLLKYKQ